MSVLSIQELRFAASGDYQQWVTTPFATQEAAQIYVPAPGFMCFRILGAVGRNLGEYTYDPLWIYDRGFPPQREPSPSFPDSMAGWWQWQKSDTDRPWIAVQESVFVYRPAPTWEPSIRYILAAHYIANADAERFGLRNVQPCR